jgi:hypothetical protein
MAGLRIIYARGFPYGAPLAIVRGGATKHPEIKGFLREQGFRWDGQLYGYTTYLWAEEFRQVLKRLRDDYGCEVIPKSGMDKNYTIDLDVEAN